MYKSDVNFVKRNIRSRNFSNMDETKLKQKIEKLRERAESTQLNLAVIGLAGQGKSTLVNSLLGYETDHPDAAEEGGQGLTETEKIRKYTREREGAVVNVWDTPGLYDNNHVDQEMILKELSRRTGGKLDLVLFCVGFHKGVRIDDSYQNVISSLTNVFSQDFWKYVLFVATFVNLSPFREENKQCRLLEGIESELKKAVRNTGVPSKIISSIPFMTAGKEPGPLPFEPETAEWNSRLFEKCLDKVDADALPVILQVRCGVSIWKKIFAAAIESGFKAMMNEPEGVIEDVCGLVGEKIIKLIGKEYFGMDAGEDIGAVGRRVAKAVYVAIKTACQL